MLSLYCDWNLLRTSPQILGANRNFSSVDLEIPRQCLSHYFSFSFGYQDSANCCRINGAKTRKLLDLLRRNRCCFPGDLFGSSEICQKSYPYTNFLCRLFPSVFCLGCSNNLAPVLNCSRALHQFASLLGSLKTTPLLSRFCYGGPSSSQDWRCCPRQRPDFHSETHPSTLQCCPKGCFAINDHLQAQESVLTIKRYF